MSDVVKKPSTKKKSNNKNTRKKRLIINTLSSSSPSLSLLPKQKKTKQKKTRKKRRLIIVSSSSPSVEMVKSKETETEKDIEINIVDNRMETPQQKTMEIQNDKYIELLESLSSLMIKKGEVFRARAYQKAQETIMNYADEILNPDQLKGKANIGPTILEKLKEYTETGKLSLLEKEREKPENILSDIYGIGPKKAKELVENGIQTVNELRGRQDELLNETQKIGLKYYEDIEKRIPRSEIVEYEKIFREEFNKIKDEGAAFEIVGSYRRGLETSGDIDMIIKSKSSAVFKEFIDGLIKKGLIIEVLSRGASKCLVISKLPDANTYRRVDFLYTNEEEYPFSVLYFTGSKTFNTVMRHHALIKGLTMNEHGLYTIVDKKKTEKVVQKFSNEKDIFDYLGIEYKEPSDRKDGRAIVLKDVTGVKKDVTKIVGTEKLKSHKKTVKINNESNKSPKTKKIKKDETATKELLNSYKEDVKNLEKISEDELSEMIRVSNKAYYNNKSLMTDNEFDILKEYMMSKYPNASVLMEVGAPIEKNKVLLPYNMPSMDKIKPDTNALSSWKNIYKGPYVISGKVDGVSGMYSTEGGTKKLYTRGNGIEGQDVSYLIEYLKLPNTKNTVIRGEFIIKKDVFESKYKSEYANGRNMVAGIINQKQIDDRIKDVTFLAYEVIKPSLTPSGQMKYLMSEDIECVIHTTTNELTNEYLSSILVQWRKEYDFEIDGVIVTDDKIYDRKSGNPDHAFAFKMVLSDQVAEVKVLDVLWSASKDGYLKPRVKIEPVNIGGVRIEYATGFNGKFIEENKIGLGAVIKMIRSGDVIPYIKEVITPASNAKMPDVPYKWNETHIDIIVVDIENNETVKEKQIAGFFKGLGVEGLSDGNVVRIIKAGYDTVPKILKMSVVELEKVDGFKNKMAEKIYNGIKEKTETSSIINIMSASNIFGRGFSETKIELIMNEYPEILSSTESKAEKENKVIAIKGMARKSATSFVERIDDFVKFIKECGLEYKLLAANQNVVKKNKDVHNPLYEKTIVITGFRDNKLEEALKLVGAKIGANVSKKTFVLLVKDKDGDSSKISEANKQGVPLMTLGEFNESYGEYV